MRKKQKSKSKKQEPKLKIDVVAVEKIIRRSPGIELQRLAVQLGYATRLNLKLRESLVAALFRYPDRVRICCDRFGCSKTSRDALLKVAPTSPEYAKMLVVAMGKVLINVYPADFEHRLVPMEVGRSPEPKCKTWIDPQQKTWTPALDKRPGIKHLPPSALWRRTALSSGSAK